MEKCDLCSGKSRMHLAYGPHNYCEKHFLKHFEARVRKTIRQNRLIESGDRVVVALSGGKDSCTTLFLLNRIFADDKSIKLSALMLDEGIPGYRDKTLKMAEEFCGELGVPYKKVSFKDELGITMGKAFRKIKEKEGAMGSTCSYCAVFRRALLNKHAKKMKADKLATGHNLDDECQSIVMNLFDNSMKRMARIGANVGSREIKEFVPRIKPLYLCPADEIIAYASFKSIKHHGSKCCPYSGEAKRKPYRIMIDGFEEKFPGTKYKIISAFEQIKPAIADMQKGEKLKECKQCGSVSANEECMVCRQLERLRAGGQLAKVKA